MEKTELMKRYEEETWFTDAIVTVKVGFAELQFPSEVYVEWLETELLKASVKASAYDRLMSGSVQGMKEWANILGKPVAIDDIGRCWWFSSIPKIINGEWNAPVKALIPDLYLGGGISDWKDSLTLPDGWETKGENK